MGTFARGCLVAAAICVSGFQNVGAQSLGKFNLVSEGDRALLSAPAPSSGFIVSADGTGSRCRKATPEEAADLNVYRTKEPLHTITGPHKVVPGSHGGLHIILRGTSQLESFPEAKQAFIRAAAIWESIILNPITVMINVDFGPTRFGVPWANPLFLGSASQDSRGGSEGTYPLFRDLMSHAADDAIEASLYASLPLGTMPTSIGDTTRTEAPSILVRVLGGLPPEADEADPRPSIGFNSAYTFDMDPSNGIDPDKDDFEALALHEIGHTLGFSSYSGLKEVRPELPILLTVWDFFRFSPGVTTGSFQTGQRSLTPGGAPVFFGGSSQIPLSTGRTDGTGGDGNHSGHWKADELTGTYIGIMDPSSRLGQRSVITANDLLAFDRMGYTVSQTVPGGTVPCVANDTTLCLNSNRFKVQVRWATNNGQSGDGHAVGITADTGYFWFFDRNNVEMVLKVINACPSRYWVFAGGLTNVQVSMTVTDTQNGTIKNYNNPQGTAFQPVQDTNAFATCP